MATLKAFAPALAFTVKAVATLRLSLKVIVVVSALSARAIVPAETVPLNVMPPELVMVSVPILVPTTPPKVTAPAVTIVRSAVPVEGPVILERLIALERVANVPSVKLLFRLIAPAVI